MQQKGLVETRLRKKLTDVLIFQHMLAPRGLSLTK